MLNEFISTLFKPFVEKASATLSTGNFGIEEVSGPLTLDQVILNIMNVGIVTIGSVCTAIFIAGAFFIASSAGNDQRKSLGKDLMIGAVMGLAIIAASKGIINITYSFLYAP